MNTMRYCIFLLFFTGLFLPEIKSQTYFLPPIPDSLSQHANAIIINEKTEVNLIHQSKIKTYYKARILIQNKKADYLSHIKLFYDPYTLIEKAKIEFYDLNGKLLQRIYKNKFKDYAASGNGTLYSDNRVLINEYTATTYPYIVDIEYKISSANTAFIPPWYAFPGYNTGVLSTTYHFTYPPDFKVYKIEKNLETYSIYHQHSKNEILYSGQHLPPLVYETLSPSFDEISPGVRLATNKFKLAGVTGTANSWEDFGQWMTYKLLKGRDNLNNARIKEIKAMVSGIENPVKRAQIIYEYMQKKVHYINVAIGIGGWQPMPADEVDKLGYGDCKALTNYTKTLLEIADVPSIYTQVYAGDTPKDIDENLIGMQGNHALLCIPQAQDSIWLECTLQKIPFGFTDNFTNNRKALAIKESGSKIIHTKQTKDEDNYQLTKASYKILNNGNITAQLKIQAYGNPYTRELFSYDGLNQEKLKEKFALKFDQLQNLMFEKIEINNNRQNKSFDEDLILTAKHYAEKIGDTTFIFAPNAFHRISFVPAKNKHRKYPFILKDGYKYEDIYTINLPDGFSLATLPDEVKINSKFGLYRIVYKQINPQQIEYHRTFILHHGKYPPELYNKYRKFRKKIKKLEKQKILISKR